MTKAELYAKAAELYRRAVAEGADEAAARAKYDAAIARITAMPDPQAQPSATKEMDTLAPTRTNYGFGRSVAQGVTFGFGDEIEAGARALLPGRTYEGEVADIRASKAQYEDAYPGRAFVGELLGGIALPGVGAAKTAANAGRAVKLGRAALTGAVGSGLSGLGTSEGSLTERLPDAAVAAGVGAVAAPAIGSIVGKLASSRPVRRITDRITGRVGDDVSALPKAQEKALGYAARAFERDRGQLSDALTTPAAAGDLVFNRGGRSVATATRVAQAIPSEATEQVPRAIAAQLDDEPGRVVDVLRRVTGRPLDNGAARLQELTDEAARRAAPAYAPMQGMVLADPELQTLIQRPSISAAVQRARKNLRDAGWREPVARGEWEPVVEAPARGAAAAARNVVPAPAALKPGMTERGLWATAKTSSGALRKVETVDTDGLLDELMRRTELDRKYHKEVRKYGPNSAVTRRNQEAIHTIYEVLEKRDNFPTEQLDDVLRQRAAVAAEMEGVDRLTLRDMERRVLQPPQTPTARAETAVARVADDAATPAADDAADEARRALLFDELDNAKKILDAEIADLEELAAAGPKRASAMSDLRSKVQARDALVDYIDRVTDGQYAEARAVAAPLIRGREAFRAGQAYGPATSRDALQLETAARSPDERALYAEGVANRIRDDVDRVRDRGNVASRFFGSPLERDKLGMVFRDNPAGADVSGALEAASRRRTQATAALVPGQSMTAPMGQAIEDFRGSDMLALAMQAKSLPSTVVTGLLKRIARLRGVDEEAAGILGRIMTAQPGSPAAQELAAQFQRLQLARSQAARVGQVLGQSGAVSTVNAGR